MKKLKIGMTASQVQLDPETATKLARTVNNLIPDLRRVVYWTNPYDAQALAGVTDVLTHNAIVRRNELLGSDNPKPVAIDDSLHAARILHGYFKKVLRTSIAILLATKNLEAHRGLGGTNNIAEQLEHLRDIVDTTDIPTLESAMSLLDQNSKSPIPFLESSLGSENLLRLQERVRDLVNNQDFS